MPRPLAERQIQNRTRRVLRFIGLSLLIYLGVVLIALGAAQIDPQSNSRREALFPPVFWITTVLLVVGSRSLHDAVYYVRIEKQREFRRCLVWGMVWGVLFVGLQSYGLKLLINHHQPGETQTGSNAFLTALSGLHAMHFAVALWWLLWVFLSAIDDRYDHEFYWGVSACAWFWHGLGIVWGVVLVVFLIASNFQ